MPLRAYFFVLLHRYSFSINYLKYIQYETYIIAFGCWYG